MIKDTDDFLFLIDELKKDEIICKGLKGIEKESLRITNENQLSLRPHPGSLGSPLHNRYITTDFSESQLELVTPEFQDISCLDEFLDELHHFVFKNIDDEIIWPLSMPPMIDNHDEIPIAEYGVSDEAFFKSLYRKGLSHRYGRLMQTISGIHFNYSLPDSFWEIILGDKLQGQNFNQIKSKFYMRGIRNIHRMNWIILYFFGCSPIVSRQFVTDQYDFKNLEGSYFYLPNATSLRMSDIGYQNSKQKDLYIPLNSIEEYSNALKRATSTISEIFASIENDYPEENVQLNSSILQIEDEYYSVSRPKSNHESNDRLISKLKREGVDYIELRSIDLNPFIRTGITRNSLKFLEAFCIFCLLKPSPSVSKTELNEFRENDSRVSLRGREKNLLLQRDCEPTSIYEWGIEILTDMIPILEALNFNSATNVYSKMLENPDYCISSEFIEHFENEEILFHEEAIKLGESHKLGSNEASNSQSELSDKLYSEARNSHKLEKISKHSTEESFKDYLKKFYES